MRTSSVLLSGELEGKAEVRASRKSRIRIGHIRASKPIPRGPQQLAIQEDLDPIKGHIIYRPPHHCYNLSYRGSSARLIQRAIRWGNVTRGQSRTQFLNGRSCPLPLTYNVVNGRLIANPRAVALEEQWNNIVRIIFVRCSNIRSKGEDQWIVIGYKQGQSFIRSVDE